MAYKSSGVKTASAAIKSTAGKVIGILVFTDGTNDGTAELKDGGSGGTTLLKVVCPGADKFKSLTLAEPVPFSTDIYLALSGTNASAIVLYK